MAFKILVVDDEPDLELLVRQKFRRKIRDGEFEFVFARNGQEALEKLRQDATLNFVMSDINMPVMDGLTLLARLSEIERVLKAVVVSAYGDLQNIRTAMNRGAYDFLTKPIDFEDFEVTLNKALRELDALQQGFEAHRQLTALQGELSVAAKIQQSILPRDFPAFPGRKEFELYAEMIPAEQVGGDFYDFFLIDRDRLGFVIGDVSGKGVPAAILMAVSRTLLRATALRGVSPGECLQSVNSVLCREHNDAALFVTTFYGILHTQSGELEYSIGGHNPPYLFSAAGEIRELDKPAGLLVGPFQNARYETGCVRLQPGDGILLYTDGITEARDPGGAVFSDARLEALVQQLAGRPAEDIIRETLAAVKGFSVGAPQSDDITLLALRYLGPW